MALQLAPPPLQDAIVDSKGRMTRVFQNWLQGITTRVTSSTFALARTAISAQAASIATTPIVLAATATIYRVSYALRITTPATSTSSATVTISWIDGGLTVTQTFAAVTGNTETTVQSGSVLLRTDPAEPISYAVVYASSGLQAMAFQMDVTAEVLA